MALDSKHPEYEKDRPDRQLMDDSYKGETAIKEAGHLYLPFCESHLLDGAATSSTSLGALNYKAYKERAIYPDYVTDAISKDLGMMHQKDATIRLPKLLEPLLRRATVSGESLVQLLRRVKEQQLLQGRVGLLADLHVVPDSANPLPYIALYAEPSIINWDDNSTSSEDGDVKLVVLDETSQEMNEEFVWKSVDKYRVLTLAPHEGKQVYRAAQFRETKTYDLNQLVTPLIRGVALNEIPFVFINATDNKPTPGMSPLLGLAKLALSIYRSEADYRYNLHMQGQDTLVVIGDELGTEDPGIAASVDGNSATRVGAGAKLSLELGGDAKYIGVSSNGLPEQRQAIAADRKLAATKTVQIGKETGEVESGDSRKIRVSAETASLTSVALASATGLEKILKIIARWVGADPEEVKVTPNLDFANSEMDGQTMVGMTTAKMQGFPICQRSMHTYAKDRGMTKMTFEEELNEINKEIPLIDASLLGGDSSGSE
jgi:hypothetical protein